MPSQPPSVRNLRFRPFFETESFVLSAQGDRRKPWVRDAFPDSPSNLKGSLTRLRAIACPGPPSDPYRIEEQKLTRYPGLPSVALGWRNEAFNLEDSAKPPVSTQTHTGSCLEPNPLKSVGLHPMEHMSQKVFAACNTFPHFSRVRFHADDSESVGIASRGRA